MVSIENFIAELVPDMYFDLGYVLLSDPLNSIELHLFTQSIPVPIEYVYQARDRTPADYPLKWSGYLVTIGEIPSQSVAIRQSRRLARDDERNIETRHYLCNVQITCIHV